MLTATWKPGLESLYKGADPQKVADEIYGIGAEVTPAQIVEAAKDEESELHKCFTWDNDKAAEKWRLQEARQVICNLVVKQEEGQQTEAPRLYYQVQGSKTYEPLEFIVNDEVKSAQLLQKALAELVAFKRKYRMLSELAPVFNTIDKFTA
ncbi:MAG: hypothetical protein LUF68_04250 [Clostridiales bacterium]|nr:hypothetical protein [Clostridiales bacterium]